MSEHVEDGEGGNKEFTGMNFIKNVAGIETFKASATGTVYAVVAKAKGLMLALTPKLEPMGPILSLYIRVRVQKMEDWANLDDGPSIFGFNELAPKSPTHWSTEVFMPVTRHPTTPFEVGTIVDTNDLVGKLVEGIFFRLEQAASKPDNKVTLVLNKTQVTEYMRERFKDSLPTDKPASLSAEEQVAVFGPEGYAQFLNSLFSNKPASA